MKLCILPKRHYNFSQIIIVGFILLVASYNAILHHPTVGYDASEHLAYVASLARGYLPTSLDSQEFFSPPLPYIVPALAQLIGLPDVLAWKVAQFSNVVLCFILLHFLLCLCDLVLPKNNLLAVSTLMTLAIMPVFYRTFAMIRGEPLLATAGVVFCYYYLKPSLSPQIKLKNSVAWGVALGIVLLSRQWGFFFIPAILATTAAILFCTSITDRLKVTLNLALGLGLTFLVATPFYIILWYNSGTPLAFNRQTHLPSLYNQPQSFYWQGLPKEIFTDPVRRSFPNQLLPLYYSDFWGDYWCSFLIWGKNSEKGNFLHTYNLDHYLYSIERPRWLLTNRESIGPYLGRVNLVALFPSLLMVLALIHVLRSSIKQVIRRNIDQSGLCLIFTSLAVLFSLVGYFMFLLAVPDPGKGATIKASYLLQICPLLALITGYFLTTLYEKSVKLVITILMLLVVVFAHNFATYFTHYF